MVEAAVLGAAAPREGGDMQSLATTFLTRNEQDRVTAEVHRAEKMTSGEIVPMIVSASHHYPMAAVRGAALISLVPALLLTSLLGSSLWLGQDNMYLFVLFFALCYFPLQYFIGRTPRLLRLFLVSDEVEEEVEEAAITGFYGEGLYRTREENGILIFISVLEHRVWILGDRGINARIEPATWQHIVDDLTGGIKDGNQAEALCQAIRTVGEMLGTHFPHHRDDTDELHNLIIR